MGPEIDKRVSYVNTLLKEVSKRLGTTPNVSSHTARRSFADHLYDQTDDLRLVQQALGHGDITTTQRYVSPFKQQKVDQANQLYTRRHPTVDDYRSLSDLFVLGCEEKCVEALRKYRPEKPVINGANQWIGNNGKDKGVIVAWIEAMERSRPSKIVCLTGTRRKELVQFLNAYFQGLNMGKDARVFSDPADSKIIESLTSLM